MADSTPRSDKRVSERSARRRAALLGAAAGIALFVLALGVFSVGQASRRVTERAGTAHAYDELLMSATVARAQIGFSALVYELGQTAEIDVSGPISSNLNDVSSSLTTMAIVVEEAKRDSDGLAPSTVDSVDRFRTRVREINNALVTGEGDVSLDPMEAAYEDLGSVVARDRDEALDLLDAADEDLTSLGSLVGVLIAFLIPTVAVVIYRELTRPQRELVELEAALARRHAQAALRRVLVNRFVERARKRPESHLNEQVERFVAATETVDGNRKPDLQAHQSGELTSFLWRAGRISGVEIDVQGPTGVDVLTDGAIAFDALRLIVRDLSRAGASFINCEVALLQGAVELRLGHDGVRRTAQEAELALLPDETDVIDLGGTKRNPDLWVSRTLLQAIGADLRAIRRDTRFAYAVVLPKAERAVVNGGRKEALALG